MRELHSLFLVENAASHRALGRFYSTAVLPMIQKGARKEKHGQVTEHGHVC
jgi:hypothetical protein